MRLNAPRLLDLANSDWLTSHPSLSESFRTLNIFVWCASCTAPFRFFPRLSIGFRASKNVDSEPTRFCETVIRTKPHASTDFSAKHLSAIVSVTKKTLSMPVLMHQSIVRLESSSIPRDGTECCFDESDPE